MTAVDYKEDQPLITSNRSNFNYRHGGLVFSSVLCINCHDTKHTFVSFWVFLGGGGGVGLFEPPPPLAPPVFMYDTKVIKIIQN